MRTTLCALTVCCLAGAAAAQEKRAEFEVASVKPNTSGNMLVMIRPPVGGRFTATNARLKMLLGIAYNVKGFEISGGPGWADSEGFDIEAKATDSGISLDDMRPMLQSLLADRFQLKVHRETKEVPIYALVAAKNGLKVPAAKEGGCTEFKPGDKLPPPPSGRGSGGLPPTPCGGFFMSPNHLEGGKISMMQLVNALSNILGQPVADKTGFNGTFDVSLDFSPEGTALFRGAQADDSRPSIFTALQDKLGLKLESQKGPEQILIIDHAEKPTEN